MNEKMRINLEGVPQTLLLPLLSRATFSQEPYSPIRDKRAIQLIESIHFDFDNLSKQLGDLKLFLMARAYHFDEAIKTYLRKNPRAVIVNLGAGLETAFHRVDNGELTWVDLDLPEVIELREKLLPPINREHYIAKSILDFSWIKDVQQLGEDVFFFSGGFFMYFTEAQVKSIFIEMATHFPRGELIFDTIYKQGLKYANNLLAKAKMKNAFLQWGLDNTNKPDKWSPRIKLVSQKPYFKTITEKFNFPLGTRIKMFFHDFFDRAGVVHLRFKETVPFES